MKKLIISSLLLIYFLLAQSSWAADNIKFEVNPSVCPVVGNCPSELVNKYDQNGESCAQTFDEFKQDPYSKHFWAEDPAVTSQGKADERARQFIFWVINNNTVEEHPIIKSIWINTRNVAYFFTLLLAAILGIGFIVGQKANFDLKIKIWPVVGKIVIALLYITFSASIILLFIQLSELLMKFFAERLGGGDLFNIYFAGASKEENYIKFIGCRDLNFRVQEAANSELFLLKLTNITYYIMGVMLILRKIILWFLLFVSPFLAILFSFNFIRNVGWIWVGVFFQWLFYGPLFSLFLGAMAAMWNSGIPFRFDFSRINTTDLNYVYPTAINILYGGPAQQLSTLNNGNYIDTFVEYVITLIMLSAVIFFPWWLLRIFRDYCCDGINAMKNILLSMYDQGRGGQSPAAPQGPSQTSNIGASLKMPKEVEIPVKIRLETLEEIKKVKTEEISKSLNLSVSNISDVAHLETNKQSYQDVRRNLDYLTNPTKADTPTERQRYMNIRTELSTRAIKEDRVARQIISATSSSRMEQMQHREELLKTTPTMVPVSHIVSIKANVSQERVSSISNSFTSSISANSQAVNTIAQNTHLQVAQVQGVLTSFAKNVSQPAPQIVPNITKDTGLKSSEVISTLQQVSEVSKTNKEIMKEVAEKEKLPEATIEKAMLAQIPLIAEPEKHIEQAVSIPATVSIEDYEEVKKMWISQYEKGEIPTTENVRTREEWVEQDIVFITNTLNKLMSGDERLRSQGLDDLAYILPIFMIGNLKGEELLVYLKAKIEAAKSVREQTEREKELTEKIKSKSEEELVDVVKPKEKEAEKTMEMKKELPIKDTK